MVKLYRGISVAEGDAERIIKDIQDHGIQLYPGAQWNAFLWKDQPAKERLLLKEDLTKDDTGLANEKVHTSKGFSTKYLEGKESICFADKVGAKYYARKHNWHKEQPIPLLIEAEVDISTIAIDGRDFLFTALMYVRQLPADKIPKTEEILVTVFGTGIKKYIQKTLNHPKSDTDAIGDLIICDDEIKKAHLQNKYVINGRYGTHFKYAFFVSVPIPPKQILNVSILNGRYQLPKPDFSLADFRQTT